MMTNALSNPYEITVGGITCKSSPMGHGWFISSTDLENLGESEEAFKKVLFEKYEAEQSRKPDGIKVFYKKPVDSH